MNYILTLTDDVTDAKIDTIKDEIVKLGAKNVEYLPNVGVVLVASDLTINFAGIDGVRSVEKERHYRTCETLIKGDV